MIILKLIVALLPVALLLAFIYWKDAKKEPASWLAKAFGLGIVIAIPVIIVGVFVKAILFGGGEPTTLFGTTIKAFFEASLPEEAAKLLALWLVLRKNPHFDEHFDGIVYAVFVGMGFAAIENVVYILGEENWITVGILRAFLSVPGHYAYAVIMGYCYSIYHFVDKSQKNAFFILFMPFMAHGIYDSIAFGSSVDTVVAIIAIPFLAYFVYKMQRIAYDRIVMLAERDQKSPIC